MIRGIGSDLVEVERMGGALRRRGEALAARLLAADELREWRDSAAPARFLAKRFAAKEAVLKALGTGLRNGTRWPDVAVGHDRQGKPEVHLRGAAARRLEAMGARQVWLSITDERGYALAFAIIEAS